MIRPQWAQLALNPPCALGEALGSGTLRAQPEDFEVEEDLGFAASGDGQHVLLKVRKRDANTQWVARELAALGRCRPADVGYAGLKDRRSVAIQWFTVPAATRSVEEWIGLHGNGFEVLEAGAHARKLPRGALAGNRFAIRIRDVTVSHELIAARLEQIRRRGVPNYFGAQRFGHDGANLAAIEAGVRALDRTARGFMLSAARSLIFNGVLAARVRDGSWEQLELGELANLDGRGSIFAVNELEPSLQERCARLALHPTGPMWGRGAPAVQGRLLQLEEGIARDLAAAAEATQEAGLTQERRSLRVAVRGLDWTNENGAIVLRFRLGRGSFATGVLREIFACRPTSPA